MITPGSLVNVLKNQLEDVPYVQWASSIRSAQFHGCGWMQMQVKLPLQSAYRTHRPQRSRALCSEPLPPLRVADLPFVAAEVHVSGAMWHGLSHVCLLLLSERVWESPTEMALSVIWAFLFLLSSAEGFVRPFSP